MQPEDDPRVPRAGVGSEAARPDEPSAGPLRIPYEPDFGRYTTLRELATGALARIHEAHDPLAERKVAIKTLRWDCLAPENIEPCRHRLQREGQALGRLCHPNVVRIFDRGPDFLVLEYLEGIRLSAVLRDRGSLDLDEALRVLAPLAAALDHMHGRGVIHRDLRPENVLLVADGTPKLIDFAAASTPNETRERWEPMSTPCHMAPEQITSHAANALTDIFSFGLLAYELLTGHQPFRDESISSMAHRVVNSEPAPVSECNPALPPAYDEIFARVLSKNPDQRQPSAAAFVRALQSNRATPPITRTSAAFQELVGMMTAPVGAIGCAISVESDPPGAEVDWNERHMGQAPVRFAEVDQGPHRVRLTKPGYAPVEAVLMKPTGPLVRLHFTLIPLATTAITDFGRRRDS